LGLLCFWGLLCFLGLLCLGCGSEVDSANLAAGAKCGAVTCAGDEYCCDADCGLCVEQGVACTELCAE
jgi:hypothetical protein